MELEINAYDDFFNWIREVSSKIFGEPAASRDRTATA